MILRPRKHFLATGLINLDNCTSAFENENRHVIFFVSFGCDFGIRWQPFFVIVSISEANGQFLSVRVGQSETSGHSGQKILKTISARKPLVLAVK